MWSESNNTSVGGGAGQGVNTEYPFNRNLDDILHEPPSNRELYVVMGILIFLSIVGTAGNALVLYVFSKKRDKLVSTLFILVMAFVDFVTCLIVIPYTVILEYINFHVEYDIFCKVYQFLITSNIPFSALIMVAIAIDRYLCICHPFWHALNITRAKIMTAALGLFATAIGVVVSLMYGVYALMSTVKIPDVPENDTTLGYLTENMTLGENNSSVTILVDIVLSEKQDMNTTDLYWSSSYDNDTVTGSKNKENEASTENVKHVNTEIYVYTGNCEPNTMILSENFQWYYQKLYTAMFLLCLIIVIVLYTLIYKSVLERRTKRQKQKSKVLHLVQTETTTATTGGMEETLITSANGENRIADTCLSVSTHHGSSNGAINIEPKERDRMLKDAKKQQQKRKSTKRDKTRMANLKTAAMLFVVTVVFILTFLPAFLMANEMIPYNMIIFYMYFANNVANPVIYSFMNKNFRDDLRKLFCATNRR